MIGNVKTVWAVPKNGGHRVLELWDDYHRICGIVDVADQSALDKVIELANGNVSQDNDNQDNDNTEVERLKDLLSQIESLASEA